MKYGNYLVLPQQNEQLAFCFGRITIIVMLRSDHGAIAVLCNPFFLKKVGRFLQFHAVIYMAVARRNHNLKRITADDLEFPWHILC